jgi:hypothetical protein
MTRKDWVYIPFPLVMAQAIDEIVEQKSKRYGVADRSELSRLIVGRFIMQYDEDNMEVNKILEEITGKILSKNDAEIEDHKKKQHHKKQFLQKN